MCLQKLFSFYVIRSFSDHPILLTVIAFFFFSNRWTYMYIIKCNQRHCKSHVHCVTWYLIVLACFRKKKKKRHDLVNNCSFGVDFKLENQKGIFSLYFAVQLSKRRKKVQCKLMKNYLIFWPFKSVRQCQNRVVLETFFCRKRIRIFCNVTWKVAKLYKMDNILIKFLVFHEKFICARKSAVTFCPT